MCRNATSGAVHISVGSIECYIVLYGFRHNALYRRASGDALQPTEYERVVRNHHVGTTRNSLIKYFLGHVDAEQCCLGFSVRVAHLKPGIVVALLQRRGSKLLNRGCYVAYCYHSQYRLSRFFLYPDTT